MRDACRDVHPNSIPKIAMLMLDETYTAVMLKFAKYHLCLSYCLRAILSRRIINDINAKPSLQNTQKGIQIAEDIKRSAADGIHDFQRYIF